MKLPAVGQTQHTFAQSPKAEISRSVFDRSHGHKTTWGITNTANQLIPVYVDECLPGDTFSMKVSAFIRLIPTIVPIMDNMYFDFFFFAVPNRLLWPNWQKFMGAQDNPGDSTSYLVPIITNTSGGFPQDSLGDHMGLPVGISPGSGTTISALPFRAYNLIWNQWFRDQNLQNSVYFAFGDGPDALSNYTLLPRGKRHDYFTSCLPLPQKAPAVPIPLGSSAPVQYLWNGNPVIARWTGTNTVPSSTTTLYQGTGTANGQVNTTGSTGAGVFFDPNGTLVANLATATAATINQLRQSFQLQKLYERDNRGGTRYTEIIKSHFGVTSPDARLQRPEFLGGGSVPVIMSPVPQTSQTLSGTPQANLAAYGTAASNGTIGFTYSATEHCTMMGLVAARADLTYQQGVDRMWSRQTRFDFYWPALAHIGEQGVQNQEIWMAGNNSDQNIFGYQERYGEYRYKPSKISGAFNSNYSAPLDYWHLAEHYTSCPTLGSTFISSGPPLSRITAVTSQDPILADLWFNLKCARPMPVYSVPGLVDHF